MKKVFGIAVVLFFAYLAVKPILVPGFFPMHDDTQVARVVEMGRALREGQFPVRWVSDLGYGMGYPLFNFYGPLPYYIGGFFYAIGISGLVATKIMMILGIVLAGLAMYLAASSIFGVWAGVASATAYMYAPYHAVDIYVRGAVGEYWAFIFLPLILLGIYNKKFLLTSLAISGLVLSHTILGFVGILFLFVFLVAIRFRRDVIKAILLGLGLSAFFWLPALMEMKFTNVVSVIGSSADFHQHFVCLSQLWNSAWGFGGSAPGCLDGLSFKIGKEFIALGLTGFIALLVVGKKHDSRNLAYAVGALIVISLFFTLAISSTLWVVIPYFAFIQYPWRFLTFVSFGFSFLIGASILIVKKPVIQALIAVGIVVIILVIESKYFVPQYVYNKTAESFETPVELRYRVSKISDEYLPPGISVPRTESEALNPLIPSSHNYSISYIVNTDSYKRIELNAAKADRVPVRLAYFPGWTIIVNVDTIKPEIEKGIPIVPIPAGLTTIQMIFKDTPVRTTGNVISIVSLVLLFFFYDRKNKKTIT